MKLKKKLDLDLISKELKQVDQVDLSKIKGGSGSCIILSEVSITADPWDDPWDGWDPWGDDSNGGGDGGGDSSDQGGGGSGGGSNNDNDNDDTDTSADQDDDQENDTVNDPDGVLEGFKNNMTAVKSALEALLESGNFPAGITEEGVQNYLDRVNEMLDTINQMETNDVKYRIEEGDGDSDGQTYFDSETGEIVVRVNNAADTALIGHELYHVEQILNGEISFDSNGNPTGVTIEDEVAAHQAQHEFKYGTTAGDYDWDGNPSPGWEVTAEWLLNKYPEYGDLPSEGDSNSGGSSGGSSSSSGG